MVMGMARSKEITFYQPYGRLGFLIAYVFLCEDHPDPPTNLELSDPYERSVRLSWVPGDSNHNPITGESRSN